MTDFAPSITYRNLEGDVLSIPKPVFQPTKAKPEPGKDDFVYTNARATRRARARARSREQRKMQAAYTKRERAKEWEANQLAQLFNLWDSLVPTDWRMRRRAHEAILARAKAVREQDQARFDKEWDARRKNRDLPPPTPVMSHEQIEQRMREIAKTAPTVGPKR